jgi:hypothetical protein
VQGTDPGTVVLQAEVVCDYKTVWRELCDIYDEVQTQEELLKVSKIVLPHLFCSETRTIGELARLTDENGEYMPLTLMIEDVESNTAHARISPARPTSAALKLPPGSGFPSASYAETLAEFGT